MVLVSHTHNFVYLKTHKTAGTSVEMLLQRFCLRPGRKPKEETNAIVSKYGVVGQRGVGNRSFGFFGKHNRIWRNHMSSHLVRDKLGAEVWNAYSKIACVRNPFDRMVSWFHWNTRDNPEIGNDFSDTRSVFRDYVLNRKWPDDTNIVFVDDVFVPDILIRKEHIRADLNQLKETLGLTFDVSELPTKKSTTAARKARSVADYFDKETVDLVRQRMEWVFERIDYPDTPQEIEVAS